MEILHDHNKYACGDINGQNVVIACLPLSHTGNLNAPAVIDPLIYRFPNIKVALLVGIGGESPVLPVLKTSLKISISVMSSFDGQGLRLKQLSSGIRENDIQIEGFRSLVGFLRRIAILETHWERW